MVVFILASAPDELVNYDPKPESVDQPKKAFRALVFQEGPEDPDKVEFKDEYVTFRYIGTETRTETIRYKSVESIELWKQESSGGATYAVKVVGKNEGTLYASGFPDFESAETFVDAATAIMDPGDDF